MVERGVRGSIVSISSNTCVGGSLQAHYGAAKAGAEQFCTMRAGERAGFLTA
jgi:NAD(P)-dependent dehydrogenase (short-subunit alcohol dehydrogenase family)